jgi:hypothetical protein
MAGVRQQREAAGPQPTGYFGDHVGERQSEHDAEPPSIRRSIAARDGVHVDVSHPDRVYVALADRHKPPAG